MKIIVLAERFENGAWKDWEHPCDEEEVEAVIDSANAKAAERKNPLPSHIDYLAGTAYIFDVASGLEEDDPKDGDTRVYGAIVDGIVIGISDKVKRHILNDSAA